MKNERNSNVSSYSQISSKRPITNNPKSGINTSNTVIYREQGYNGSSPILPKGGKLPLSIPKNNFANFNKLGKNASFSKISKEGSMSKLRNNESFSKMSRDGSFSKMSRDGSFSKISTNSNSSFNKKLSFGTMAKKPIFGKKDIYSKRNENSVEKSYLNISSDGGQDPRGNSKSPLNNNNNLKNYKQYLNSQMQKMLNQSKDKVVSISSSSFSDLNKTYDRKNNNSPGYAGEQRSLISKDKSFGQFKSNNSKIVANTNKNKFSLNKPKQLFNFEKKKVNSAEREPLSKGFVQKSPSNQGKMLRPSTGLISSNSFYGKSSSNPINGSFVIYKFINVRTQRIL